MKTNIFLDIYRNDEYCKNEIDSLVKLLTIRKTSAERRNTRPFNLCLSDYYLEIMCVKDDSDLIIKTYNKVIKRIDILNNVELMSLEDRRKCLVLFKIMLYTIAVNKAIHKYFPQNDISDDGIHSLMDSLSILSFEYNSIKMFITNDIFNLLCLRPDVVYNECLLTCNNTHSIQPQTLYTALYNIFHENNIDVLEYRALLELNDLRLPFMDYTNTSEYYKPI